MKRFDRRALDVIGTLLLIMVLVFWLTQHAQAQSRTGRPPLPPGKVGNGRPGVHDFRPPHEGDRLARIYFADKPERMKHGAVFGTEALTFILFINEPCNLNLAQRENMRRAWQIGGALGCWYPTVDDGFTFIGAIGFIRHMEGSWESYPLAWVHTNGTTTVDDPQYDFQQAQKAFWQRKSAEVLSHFNEKP